MAKRLENIIHYGVKHASKPKKIRYREKSMRRRKSIAVD